MMLQGIIQKLNEKEAYREMSSVVNTKEMESPLRSPREKKKKINEIRHKFEKFRRTDLSGKKSEEKKYNDLVLDTKVEQFWRGQDQEPTDSLKLRVETEIKNARKIKPENDFTLLFRHTC